jgi:hypothetical protein
MNERYIRKMILAERQRSRCREQMEYLREVYVNNHLGYAAIDWDSSHNSFLWQEEVEETIFKPNKSIKKHNMMPSVVNTIIERYV